MDKKTAALAIFAAASLMGGCTMYPDGRLTNAWDQTAIKAQLEQAEKEYGGR